MPKTDPFSDPRTALLLGVPFHDVTMAETLDRLDALIARGQPCYLATANLDFAEQAHRDVELQRILLEAELVLCDGTPLVWASRWLGAPLRERVAGSDLLPHLFARAAEKGHRLFFLGASEETLATATAKCTEQWPGVKICGTYAPPHARLLEIGHEEIVRRIREAKPDLLLVAMGCPKQEKWIFMHYRELGVPVSIGIGASLDFIAGKFKRAPVWMRVSGAEWIFRLLQEPRRLVGRYLGDLLFFRRAHRRQKRLLQTGSRAQGSGRALDTRMNGQRCLRWFGYIDGTVQPVQPEGTETVALDCSAVTGIDTLGLGIIAQSWRHCHQAGATLVILRPSPIVREALALTRLDQQMPVAATENEVTGWAAPAVRWVVETLTLELNGELTAATVPQYEAYLTTAWQGAPQARRLQLALGKITFMDSSGLGLLVKLLKVTRQRPEGGLELLDPSPNVLNVIHLANLGPLLGLTAKR